jgi:hypothetical protein
MSVAGKPMSLTSVDLNRSIKHATGFRRCDAIHDIVWPPSAHGWPVSAAARMRRMCDVGPRATIEPRRRQDGWRASQKLQIQNVRHGILISAGIKPPVKRAWSPLPGRSYSRFPPRSSTQLCASTADTAIGLECGGAAANDARCQEHP